MTRQPLSVTLYGKPGCHLCEDAARLLEGLRNRYPHRLVEVDVESDPLLLERYQFAIPVLQIGAECLWAPIRETEVVRALGQALAR